MPGILPGRPPDRRSRGTFGRVRWAIAIPQYVRDGTFDPGGLRAYLTRAEELASRAPGPRRPAWRDARHQPARADVLRGRLHRAPAAWLCGVREPAPHPRTPGQEPGVARPAQRGRIEVGLGVGGGFRDFAAFGLDNAHLVTRFTEGVAMMKALWTEEAVTFQAGSGRRRASTWSPSRSRSRTRRCGSAAATPTPCAGRSGWPTGSSAPARPRPPTSPPRWACSRRARAGRPRPGGLPGGQAGLPGRR